MTTQQAPCPTCHQIVPIDKGYLADHNAVIQRGQLTTGVKQCEMSNHRPTYTNLKTVVFEGICATCGIESQSAVTETYPGSLVKEGGVLISDCLICSHEKGKYCFFCDEKLTSVEIAEYEQCDSCDMGMPTLPAGSVWTCPSNDPTHATFTHMPARTIWSAHPRVPGGAGSDKMANAALLGRYTRILADPEHCVGDDSGANKEDPHMPVDKPEKHVKMTYTDNHVIDELEEVDVSVH